MVDEDILLEKSQQIKNCLQRIYEKTQGNPALLNNLDVQDIVVLNLQRAVQTVIDMASHVTADQQLGLPKNLRENFTLLEAAKWISPKLSKQLQNMVGFRNIAVHDYQSVDVEVLKGIVKDHLKDLEDFYHCILERAGLSS